MRAALFLLLISCAGMEQEAENEQDVNGCGTERWAIKTATDANAASIAKAPVAGTIAALSALPAQNGNDTDRIGPTEVTTYQLTDVKLVQYRREADGDYHLVVSDGTRTMIVEIADPACAGATGPLLAQMTNARAQFDAVHAPVLSTPSASNETVTVTGVGFYDVLHAQTGVAPNAIELHPVLSICFGALCGGPPPSAQPPPVTHTGCTQTDATPWLALLPFLRRRRTAAV